MTDEPLHSDPHDALAPELATASCTCASLRRTTRVVTKFYEDALKPSGLTPGQFTVLAVLLNRGERRQSEISELLAMERTTLIRNLRPLEARGLIVGQTSGPRRAKTLDITSDGKKVHQRALPHWRRAQSKIIETLGTNRWNSLMRDLVTTADSVQSV
jgi:DNA-binding MarR family transcriptional regulator